jgi:hypothetical protein
MNNGTNTIIQNAIRIKETGEFLVSQTRHNFVQYTARPSFLQTKADDPDAVADRVYIDGGLDYIRRGFGGQGVPHEEWSLCSEHDFESEICQKLLWGTRGKDGKSPQTWKLIRDLDTDHLGALLDYAPMSAVVKRVVDYWLGVRTSV